MCDHVFSGFYRRGNTLTSDAAGAKQIGFRCDKCELAIYGKTLEGAIRNQFDSIEFPFNNQTIELFPMIGAGMIGLFYEVADLLSDDPDDVAWGTIGLDKLTPEWREVAERNGETLDIWNELQNAKRGGR
jgi:hypothetical protein